MPCRLQLTSGSTPAAIPGVRAVRILAVTFSWLILLAGCTTLPGHSGRSISYALSVSDTSSLARQIGDQAANHPGKTGVLLLNDGRDAFVARHILANRAERSIDAQYYLYHDDLTGRLFTHALISAADRGVRVRLLVDDVDFGGREFGASILSRHPNMEVRLFNPFSRASPRLLQLATTFDRVTRRMHNKSFTVDNVVSIIGGRNIGDEYFDAGDAVNFNDLDAMIVGPVVVAVSASFDEYWNSDLAYPAELLNNQALDIETVRARHQALGEFLASEPVTAYVESLKESNLTSMLQTGRLELDWVDARLVSDDPEKITTPRDENATHMVSDLAPLFQDTRDDLVIISPYFVPGKEGAAFISGLASSGVRVRVLTNSLAATDVAVVHAGYSKYREDLLRAGVQIYESAPTTRHDAESTNLTSGSSVASLHVKSFVFDRRHVFIGSLNLDPRSLTENTEIGLVFDSPTVASDILKWFDQFTATSAYRLELRQSTFGNDKIVWHDPTMDPERQWAHEPESGFFKRIGVIMMRLLPIESHL